MALVGVSRSLRLMRPASNSRFILPTNPYARPVSQRRRHLSARILVSRLRRQQRENEAGSAVATGNRRASSHTMQSYLFISGYQDGLSFPVADYADFVQWPIGVTDSETYARESLSVGDAFIDIFRHERLTPGEVFARILE